MMGEGTAPELPLHLVENFLKFPENWIPPEAVGVATNSRGHVYVAEELGWRLDKLIGQ